MSQPASGGRAPSKPAGMRRNTQQKVFNAIALLVAKAEHFEVDVDDVAWAVLTLRGFLESPEFVSALEELEP